MNNEGVVGSKSSFKLQAVYFDFFVLPVHSCST